MKLFYLTKGRHFLNIFTFRCVFFTLTRIAFFFFLPAKIRGNNDGKVSLNMQKQKDHGGGIKTCLHNIWDNKGCKSLRKARKMHDFAR